MKALYIILLVIIPFLASSQIITIDTTITYQTIHSWEAGTSIVVTDGENIATDPMINIVKEDLAKYAVDTLGINRLRLEVRAGSENTRDYWNEYIAEEVPYEEWRANRYANINDNDDPDDLNMDGYHFSELDVKINNAVLPVKEYLESKGEKLYINLCYVAFTGQIKDGEYIHRDPQEYGEFILAVFTHMQQTYGFVPDGVEAILEPDVANFGTGTLVGECVVAAGDKLKANGYNPEFIGLSNTNLFNANNPKYYNDFIEVEGVLNYWKEYSYHCYAGRTDSLLNALAERADSYGLRTSMLEWWTNGNTYERLHTDLKVGNNSTWQYRFSLGTHQNSDNNGGLTRVTFDDDNNYTITPKHGVPYIGFYQRNIRPGDVRVEASTNDSKADPIAFKTPDGRIKVVVSCSEGGVIDFENIPQGIYSVRKMTGNPRQLPNGDELVVKDIEIADEDVLSVEINGQGIIIIEQTDLLNTFVANEELLIYPNPFDDHIMVGINGRFEYKIYNMQGDVIINATAIDLIDTSNLIRGSYILEVKTGNTKLNQKIIKR